MASKTYEIAFQLAGKLAGNFKSSFTVANKSVGALSKKIEELNELNDKMKEKAKSGLGQLGAVGATAGAAVGLMAKSGNDYVVALAQMQAQTGATDKEMKELSASARELYKSGKGESFDAVTTAMVNLRQASGLSGEALKEATGHALTLGKVFGFEVNESTRAATQLMKQFGVDANTAYGLIASGAQNGANKNGDLLDTFNEYSVHYKSLGLSAEQMTAHMIAGAKSGVWSIDKLADATKEFNIRSKDASKASFEAYQMAGLNGAEMTKAFASGGNAARDAFFKTVKAIESIEDPVKRNAASVGIFGTQFEDIEKGALKTFLEIEKASIDATGTLKGIEGVIGKDLGSALEKVKRGFGDAMVPATTGMAEALNAQMPAIQAAMAKLSPVIAQAGNALIANMPAIVDGITSATQSAVNFATTISENWGTIGPMVKGIGAALLLLKLSPAILTPFISLATSVMNVRKEMLLMNASATAAKGAVGAGSAAMSAMSTVAGGTTGKIGGMKKAFGLLNGVMRANPIGAIITAFGLLVTAGVALWENWDTIKAKVSELWDWVSNFFGKIGSAISDAWDKAKGFFSGKKSTIEVVAKNGGGGVPKMASGGIVTAPTLAIVGEGREAEAVLPLSKLSSMLGGAGGVQVTFAPVINISGGGDAYGQVKRGLEEGQASLKRELERLLNNQKRLSYV